MPNLTELQWFGANIEVPLGNALVRYERAFRGFASV